MLVEHDVPLEKNACRINYTGGIRVPLGAQFPEKFFCEAKNYEFFGGEQQQYSIKITFNTDRFGHLQAEYTYDGWAQRKHEASIRDNIGEAFASLKERYDAEIEEERRIEEEERKKFEQQGYHCDDFSGSDF